MARGASGRRNVCAARSPNLYATTAQRRPPTPPRREPDQHGLQRKRRSRSAQSSGHRHSPSTPSAISAPTSGRGSCERRAQPARRRRAHRRRGARGTPHPAASAESMRDMTSTPGTTPEMFRRRFWLEPAADDPGRRDQPHGHGLVRLRRSTFRGIDVGRPGARHRSCSSGAAGRS